VPDIFLGFQNPSSAIDRGAPRSESEIPMLTGGKHTTRTTRSVSFLCGRGSSFGAFYILWFWYLHNHKCGKICKKCLIFLKKGIDFIENLRYNWTVHEQKIKQEV